jgi:uncharacterized protein
MTAHIPLKGSTAGRQYAGWEPCAVEMEGLGDRVLAGQCVPVAGGAELNADVYTPRTPGRYPAVVSFGGYATETHTAGIPTGSNEIGSPPVFTDRGYCPVIVERRGMGRSTGEQVMFFDPQDIDDHEAVIALGGRAAVVQPGGSCSSVPPTTPCPSSASPVGAENPVMSCDLDVLV